MGDAKTLMFMVADAAVAATGAVIVPFCGMRNAETPWQ